jgi:hypothetical protein
MPRIPRIEKRALTPFPLFLKEMYGAAQALGVSHVNARGRRDQRRAKSDKSHVDAAAYDDPREDGKYISQ